MNITQQIADHLRQIHFGGNWTGVCLRDKLNDVSWRQATTPTVDFHSIATLVYHMNYFIEATIDVLEGRPLEARDKFSFDCPAIQSEEDWDTLVKKTWADAEKLAGLIEAFPEDRLGEDFVDAKYGNYYRCLLGPIEHCHYHLGQIALIKQRVAALEK